MCKLPSNLRPSLTQEVDMRTKENYKKSRPNGKTWTKGMGKKDLDKGNDKGKKKLVPYSSPADAMTEGVDRNSGSSSLVPSSSASASLFSSRSRRSHSEASLPASSSAHQLSHIRGGEEVERRLSAPPIGQEVADFPPALPLPGLLPHLPTGFSVGPSTPGTP